MAGGQQTTYVKLSKSTTGVGPFFGKATKVAIIPDFPEASDWRRGGGLRVGTALIVAVPFCPNISTLR